MAKDDIVKLNEEKIINKILKVTIYEQYIIERLLENSGWAKRDDMLASTGLIENFAVDESIAKLVHEGLMIYCQINETQWYKISDKGSKVYEEHIEEGEINGQQEIP